MTQNIIIDPGRRYFKATSNKGDTITIASTAGLGKKTITYSIRDDFPELDLPPLPEPDEVTFNNATYLVGKGVERYVHPVEGIDLLQGYSVGKALFYTALYRLLGAGEHSVDIYVACPVDHDHKVNNTLDKGKHRFNVNGSDIAVNVNEVIPFPAPLGSALLGNNLLSTEGVIAVVDVGFWSTNLYVVQNGIIHDASATIPTGIRIAVNALQRQIKETHGGRVGIFEADELLYNPQIIRGGVSVDINALVSNAQELMITSLISKLMVWANIEFAQVLLTGGGAMLSRNLKQMYSSLVVVDDPITANVRGFAKHLKKGG